MEWISVKEGLPENDDMVLVADFNYISDVLSDHYFLGFYINGNWKANTSESFVSVSAGWNGGIIVSDVRNADVTHWMPLPEPPKYR